MLPVQATSILDEINVCRLSRAKRLLSETNLIMKRVAYLSGFSSADRMRLAFLKYANLSPSQYRRKMARRQISLGKQRTERSISDRAIKLTQYDGMS